MQEKIGFIGLGAMGAPMVLRLLDAGHRVVVHDLDASAVDHATAAGAQAAGSPIQVGAEAEIVMVSLPTPDVVRRVALGENGLAKGGRAKIYVDLSTTGARVAQEVAAGLTLLGVVSLDAPVSGGVVGAKAGTLTSWFRAMRLPTRPSGRPCWRSAGTPCWWAIGWDRDRP
jgi:3-hydroxyisobutyrate dehydrogenase-like beta-hydroxyacid dehydrogenase